MTFLIPVLSAHSSWICAWLHTTCAEPSKLLLVSQNLVSRNTKSLSSLIHHGISWYRDFYTESSWAKNSERPTSRRCSRNILLALFWDLGLTRIFNLGNNRHNVRTMCFCVSDTPNSEIRCKHIGLASIQRPQLTHVDSLTHPVKVSKFSTVLHRFSRHWAQDSLPLNVTASKTKDAKTSTTSKDFPKTFRGLPSWPAAASSHRRISHIRRLRDREFGNCDFEPSPTLETEWVAHHRIHRHIAPCRALHIHLLAFGLEFTGDTSLFESQNNIM